MDPIEAAAPLPETARFYAYLAGDKPAIGTTIEGLVQSGLPGRLFVRESNAQLPGLPDRIERLPRIPDLADAIQQASLVVNHGSLDTAQAALGMGRPQLMIPLMLDQTMVAARAQRAGIGLSVGSAALTAERVAGAMRYLAEDDQAPTRIADVAHRIRDRGQHAALPQLVERCCSLMGQGSRPGHARISSYETSD